MLSRLYDFTFGEPRHLNLDCEQWGKDNGFDEEQCLKTYDEAQSTGHAELSGVFGSVIQLTSSGVEFCELNGVGDPVLIDRQKIVRQLVLGDLYLVHRENRRHGKLFLHHLQSRLPATESEIYSALRYLQDEFLVDSEHMKYFITDYGQQHLEEGRALQSITERWEALCALDAGTGLEKRRRGRQLEALLQDLINLERGWSAAKNVLSRGEENDLIVKGSDKTVLVSCKWVGTKIQPKEPREVSTRIQLRKMHAVALVASMSGFTKAVIEEAPAIPTLVLLAGRKDFDRLFRHEWSWSEMFWHKYARAVEIKRYDWE